MFLKFRKYLPIFIFLGSVQVGFSQQKISGTVLDSTARPIAYANIVLLTEKDSSVVRGTISSEQGGFSLDVQERKKYLLKISFVGYMTYLEKVSFSEIPLKIVLKESPAKLGEVTLKVNRPKIHRAPDRLIFDVENTSLSSGSTWNILEKTPGIITMQGQLNIRNTPATIYLNGRKVRLPAEDVKTLLESYAGENIKQIEVIPNPPASFEAESGPILNIVTSSNLIPGYKGSLYGKYTQAIYPKYSIGTSHFYKTEKLDLFVNYSFHPRKEFKNDESYINFINGEGEIFSKWRSDFDRTTHSAAHNMSAILDYSIDENNSINFQASGLFSPGKKYDNTAVTHIYSDSDHLDSLFTTDSQLENDLHNIAIDLGYEHAFQKEGTLLSASVHVTDYKQERAQEVFTHYFDDSGLLTHTNDFLTNAAQKTHIYAGQLDFETIFGTWNFVSGLKISNVNSESGLDFYDLEGNAASFNSNLSDLFLYDETVFAGYVGLAKEWEKWSAKLGLRGEQTNREGTSVATDTKNERHYFELFPSAYISYKISKNHQLSFDYGRKISRPRYEALNPFKYFINENNFKSGNPNLEASISNNFNLNYTYKNAYSFDVYYRNNGPNAAQLVFQDNEALIIRSLYVNVEESKSYGLDFFHGRSLKNWWYSQVVLSLFHEEETFLALESDHQMATNETDGLFASLYNGVTFSKDRSFSGDLTFLYISSFIQGSYQMKDILTLSFGVRKSLWKNRAEISLHLEDVLNETAVPLTSNYLDQDNGFFSHPENRYVRIGFKYNFGNFRLTDNERESSTEERERL